MMHRGLIRLHAVMPRSKRLGAIMHKGSIKQGMMMLRAREAKCHRCTKIK